MRKYLSTALFFSTFSPFYLLSQNVVDFGISKQLNPAMDALTHRVTSNLFATGAKNKFSSFSEFNADYSRFLSKYKVGVGIHLYNMNGKVDNYYSVNREMAKLYVNKQFTLKNNLVFSSGVGIGYITRGLNIRSEEQVYDNNRENSLQLEGGFALKGERFQLGLSGGYQFALNSVPYNSNQILVNASASYTFGKAEGLQFTPHALISQFGSNIGGLVSYKSKYRVGAGVSKGHYYGGSFGPFASAGFTIRDKFEIDYTYNFSGYNPFLAAPHSFSLKMKFGKR